MVIEVKNLTKLFISYRGMFMNMPVAVKALDDVSFQLQGYTTLGIVGESGSGKSTLARIILRLIPATSGKVIYDRQFISNIKKDIGIIFQDPYNSLDPRMRVKDLLAEPLLIHRIVDKKYVKDKAIDLLRTVGLEDNMLDRYPRQFSGGQRQRICIARAIASQPKVLVLDEPISSLDLTIQAKLLQLFLRLKAEFDLTYIFISHNLAVIKYMADSIMVMKNGSVVEQARRDEIFEQPKHPYTRQLLDAAR